MSHELLGGLSVTGSWWKGDFHNLTNTVNQSWTTADYTPFTWYNPTTGQPFTVYARSAAARTGRPATSTRTIRSAGTSTSRTTSRAGGAFRAAARSAAASRSSVSASRRCTSPDDPNYGGNGLALCDDFELDIPWRPQVKMSGTKEIGYGINVSMSFQNNSSPNSTRVMTATRGTTRYPANCPSPCPAGQIIMPTATLPGQSTLTYNLESNRVSSVERIVQLDFKVARTFRFGRYQVLPTFEVFNLNNSDAIISYIIDQHAVVVVPLAEQHHAGPHVWVWRRDALVTINSEHELRRSSNRGGPIEGSPLFLLARSCQLPVASCQVATCATRRGLDHGWRARRSLTA